MGTPELHAWLDEQAHTLNHAADGVCHVLIALRRLPVHLAADPLAVVEARDGTVTYFTKRLASGLRHPSSGRLSNRQWQHGKRQQDRGRGATQGLRDALGTCSRRSTGGA